VSIVDRDFAVAAGQGGVAFRTFNGGETWQNVGWPATNLPITFYAEDAKFIDRDHGWLVGAQYELGLDYSVWRTDDGGLTWRHGADLGGLVSSIDFQGQRGWMGSNQDNFIFRTNDGGDHWVMTPIPQGFISGAKVRFSDPDHGWVVGWYGYMARSSDGGATWTQLPIRSEEENYLEVKPLSATEAVIVGHDRLGSAFMLRTSNAGASWARTSFTSPYAPISYNCVDACPGGRTWLAGFDGRIIATGAPCYANCDASTAPPLLDVNDFVCFQSRFAAGDPYADCDHSSSLNVLDFVCFQSAFAAGCR
jgi:photosystem II stability/assembly factor-like uncharacterized protein